MPVTEDRPAPYAPPSAIIDFVSRYRHRNVPFPVTADVLARIGVSQSLIPRTLQALQTLDLINEIGNPTEILEGIRLAPEAEYKKRLTDWLESAYSGIFAIVDPAKDDAIRIRDAFRGYNPVGQQDRMVTLFEGLCTEAGLISQKTSAPRTAPPARQRLIPPPSATVRSIAKAKAKAVTGAALPPAIAGLMESLPSPADGWTAADRAKFLKTFESVLDFSIPVIKEKKETAA